MRHSATRAILERDDVIIVASVSCIYGIGAVETYSGTAVTMARGKKIDRMDLMRDLSALQYRRNDNNFVRGAFRVRGDTVDIFPAHYEDRAWRVELFGDVVDSITEFDPLTGRPAGALDTIKIYANSHYVTPRPTLQQALKGIKAELITRLADFRANDRLAVEVFIDKLDIRRAPGVLHQLRVRRDDRFPRNAGKPSVRQ